MRIRTFIAASVMALGSVGLVHAEDAPATLGIRMADPAFAERIDALFGNDRKPDWLSSSTQSEPVAVTMAGLPYTVLLACKKHDCANHQLAVMVGETTLYGLQAESRDNSNAETLTWLGIGGGPESIDGKTILYAAISGSLFNHPEAFQFR